MSTHAQSAEDVAEAWASWVADSIIQQLEDEGVHSVDDAQFHEVMTFVLSGIALSNIVRPTRPISEDK